MMNLHGHSLVTMRVTEHGVAAAFKRDCPALS
jgi:hypothetical protein